MRMMKAQVMEGVKNLVYKDVPVPVINDDEVLVKVKLCGICGTDWNIFIGKYVADRHPLIPGHEFWGVIEQVGKNVVGLKVGDRVSPDACIICGHCYFCRRGEGLMCQSLTQIGIHIDGAFAEYVKVPWKKCYLIPDEISDDATAAFIEPLTCVVEAAKRMDSEIGASVAIIGCGLGVVHAAVAKLRGAAPIIVIGDSANKLKIAMKMGADHVIDINKMPNVVEKVMQLTGGVGVDYAIEAVGSPATYEQALAMLRRGGKLEAFGVCGEKDIMEVKPVDFVLNEKRICGSLAGIGNDWGVAINLLKHKRLDPSSMFSMVVPLAELETALKEIQDNKELMKVFVSPEIKERTFF